MAILCPVLIWLVCVFFLTSICFTVREGIDRLRRLHQIPCSHCAYFTGDYRLKCTVHPCKAFSEEALNCLDYEPRVVRPSPVIIWLKSIFKKVKVRGKRYWQSRSFYSLLRSDSK